MNSSLSAGNDLEFRPANADDATRIRDFQLAMARETERLELDPATCALGVQAVFGDSALGRYFVAERSGEVIACLLSTSEWSDWRNGRVWWIHSVYVRPQDRGQGVFSRFYAFIREQVERDAQARGIRLYVDRSNLAAQAIYQRLGMVDHHYNLFEWMKG